MAKSFNPLKNLSVRIIIKDYITIICLEIFLRFYINPTAVLLAVRVDITSLKKTENYFFNYSINLSLYR
ncbi:MAG: hypothetical protein A2W91_04325 [Bacteroidetes bacterium GWF2_38_335]|nr:MAG: hypothetical protein A2W91_04325 [Bacteroidetes bacterium GWF2_38_335]HBS88267.1 hypothetical protein [Bacteroidales bacterium]